MASLGLESLQLDDEYLGQTEQLKFLQNISLFFAFAAVPLVSTSQEFFSAESIEAGV